MMPVMWRWVLRVPLIAALAGAGVAAAAAPREPVLHLLNAEELAAALDGVLWVVVAFRPGEVVVGNAEYFCADGTWRKTMHRVGSVHGRYAIDGSQVCVEAGHDTGQCREVRVDGEGRLFATPSGDTASERINEIRLTRLTDPVKCE